MVGQKSVCFSDIVSNGEVRCNARRTPGQSVTVQCHVRLSNGVDGVASQGSAANELLAQGEVLRIFVDQERDCVTWMRGETSVGMWSEHSPRSEKKTKHKKKKKGKHNKKEKQIKQTKNRKTHIFQTFKKN